MQVDSEFNAATNHFNVGPFTGRVSADNVSTPEPATNIEQSFERVSERNWDDLFRHIAAMAGSGRITLTVTVEPSDVKGPPEPVRIVTDPAAPALQPQDVDHLYPWRQKDLLRELNQRLDSRMLNSYDIQAVRRQHRLDEHPEYVFNLPGAGRRYSPAVADWMMDEFARDPEFFQHARAADHALMKMRRQKPK
jgi:hypothetical protein